MPDAVRSDFRRLGPREIRSLAKLVEECGEVGQVAGKLLAYPDGQHPDGGSRVHLRLQDAIAETLAACRWVMNTLGLDHAAVDRRVAEKTRMFEAWQQVVDREHASDPVENAPALGRLGADGTVRLPPTIIERIGLRPGDFVYYLNSSDGVAIVGADAYQAALGPPGEEA